MAKRAQLVTAFALTLGVASCPCTPEPAAPPPPPPPPPAASQPAAEAPPPAATQEAEAEAVPPAWLEQRIRSALTQEQERLDRDARAPSPARRGAGGDLQTTRARIADPTPSPSPPRPPAPAVAGPTLDRQIQATTELILLFDELERELAGLEATHRRLGDGARARPLTPEQQQELLKLQLEIEALRGRLRSLKAEAAKASE